MRSAPSQKLSKRSVSVCVCNVWWVGAWLRVWVGEEGGGYLS